MTISSKINCPVVPHNKCQVTQAPLGSLGTSAKAINLPGQGFGNVCLVKLDKLQLTLIVNADSVKCWVDLLICLIRAGLLPGERDLSRVLDNQ